MLNKAKNAARDLIEIVKAKISTTTETQEHRWNTAWENPSLKKLGRINKWE